MRVKIVNTIDVVYQFVRECSIQISSQNVKQQSGQLFSSKPIIHIYNPTAIQKISHTSPFIPHPDLTHLKTTKTVQDNQIPIQYAFCIFQSQSLTINELFNITKKVFMRKPGSLPKNTNNNNKLSKRHCKDDTACQHCCSCWIKFQKYYEVNNKNLQTENTKLKAQVAFLKQINMELTSKLHKVKDIEKQLSNLEGVKENLRQQLWEKLLEQKQVEDMLREQKIKQLQSELLEKSNLLAELTQKNNQQNQYIGELEERNQQLQNELSGIQQQNQELCEQLAHAKEQIDTLSKKLEQTEGYLRQKEKVVKNLIDKINELQGNYIKERVKASNLEVDKQNLERNVQYKDGYIATLTKCSEENIKKLGSLEMGNRRLTDLVNNMDIKLAADRVNEEYLKERLVGTEEKLFMAETAANFNSGKVQAMKNDLWALKMSL